MLSFRANHALWPQIFEARRFLDTAGLFNYAVKALGRQMRTEAELRRLMKSRVEPDERARPPSLLSSPVFASMATWTTPPLPRPTPPAPGE